MKIEDIEKMKTMSWYHKIELGNGIITPGNDWDYLWSPMKEQMKKVDFADKRVLDIGCWDGLWSFEAEKMGASEVVATDIRSQRSFSDQEISTFEFAKKHLNSKVDYIETSVYELDGLFRNEFDIVMFFGVLYHLRYPQLAVANIRNVLKTGGVLLIETAIFLDIDDTIIQTDYKKIYPQDRSTWNVFSVPALHSLLQESYLAVEQYETILRQDEENHIGRGWAIAMAFSGVNHHHYFPDLFLKRYFKPTK